MKQKVYTCVVCNIEKQTQNEWPTYRTKSSGVGYEPVCPGCLKAADAKEIKKIKKGIKSAAKIVLPGGTFGI